MDKVQAGLRQRRNQTERLHQACVTAIGTGGIGGALHASFSVPLFGNGGLDDLINRLNGVG